MEKLLFINQTEEVKDIVRKIKQSFTDTVKDEFITKKSFSPSSLVWADGACPRRWALAFKGADWYDSIDPVSMARMNSGTARHEQLQEILEAGPLDIESERNLRNEDPPINSYCDIVIKYDGKEIPVEIKTAGNDGFNFRKTSLKPAAYHLTQLLIYMRLLKSDLGFIMYENRDNFEKLMIPVHMTPEREEYLDYLFDWMKSVHNAHKDGEMPAEFKGKRKNSRICKGCPVRKACEDGSNPATITLPLLESIDKRGN